MSLIFLCTFFLDRHLRGSSGWLSANFFLKSVILIDISLLLKQVEHPPYFKQTDRGCFPTIPRGETCCDVNPQLADCGPL